MKGKIKKLAIVLLMLCIAAFLTLKVKQRKRELSHMKAPSTAPLPVQVATVKMGKLQVTEHYLAEIKPVLSARISSKISGFLLEMNKYEGDRVKKGEIIARIDARSIKNKIDAIKAEIEGVKSDMLAKKHIYERNLLLYKNKAISKEQYETSKASYELSLSKLKRLEYDLRSAKVELSYAVIKAPFDGVVLKRLSEPGDLITPGTRILEIECPAKGYRIMVKVPQISASKFKAGGCAYLVESGKRIKAKIYKIHPAVETEMLATVEIRTKTRPFGLPTYGRVGVELVVSEPYGAIVPLRSVLENVSSSYVFVAKPINANLAKVHVVAVKVLGRSGDYVVVRGKVAEGELVICADEATLLRLYEGEKVRIEPVR